MANSATTADPQGRHSRAATNFFTMSTVGWRVRLAECRCKNRDFCGGFSADWPLLPLPVASGIFSATPLTAMPSSRMLYLLTAAV